MRARRSIREFCKLSMPVIMFDKDGNYVVLRLEEVMSVLVHWSRTCAHWVVAAVVVWAREPCEGGVGFGNSCHWIFFFFFFVCVSGIIAERVRKKGEFSTGWLAADGLVLVKHNDLVVNLVIKLK